MHALGPCQVAITKVMALANNPTNHDRSKHIDMQHHFIRENIENKIKRLIFPHLSWLDSHLFAGPDAVSLRRYS